MLAAMQSVENRCPRRQLVIGEHYWLVALGNIGAILASTIFCSSSPGADSPAARFSITSSGQPAAEIVVEAEHPEPPIVFAAEELRRYVKAMSGAELPLVRTPSGKPAIVLVSRPLAQDQSTLADTREQDHYRLHIEAGKLQIEGASPRAVLFGV